ncbi:hypothetical protein [Streptomyces sp. t99]|uniref:hypothetical protein n=1 Tax=Streptomyces sp. t99 TaxID=1828172 RepID=UPI00117C489D|nr:hypothetical protein [Streptomyces sp. t99]
MTEQWTSALSFSSFAAPRRADGTPAASDPRHDVEETALHWQSHSSRGGAAGWASLNSLEAAGVQGRGILINRVVEIHGLSGSIGEQLTLAWAAEQDAQRFQDPEIERDPGHLEEILTVQRMAVRALCEMSTHFLLGAAHSLANLVLRVTLCNSLAAEVINAPKKNRKAKGFEPGTDLPSAWPTFSSSPAIELWAQVLPEAAEASGIDGIKSWSPASPCFSKTLDSVRLTNVVAWITTADAPSRSSTHHPEGASGPTTRRRSFRLPEWWPLPRTPSVTKSSSTRSALTP